MESIIDLPIVVPHPVVGIAILSIAGRNHWLGQILSRLGVRIMGSVTGIITVLTFVGLPFFIGAYHPMIAPGDDLRALRGLRAEVLPAGRLLTGRALPGAVPGSAGADPAEDRSRMIRIRYLDVRLGEFTLTDIDLRIEEGGFFVLMGPTGAGKTVLLEAIAGLVPVQAGGIEIAGRGHENRRGFFAIGPRRSSSAGTRFPAA